MIELAPSILLQLKSPPPDLSQRIISVVGGDIFSFGKAILILLIGWIIAVFVRKIIRQILNQTEIDNQIASRILGREDEGQSIPIEKWVSEFAYWIIILFAVVAFLNTLNLQEVSKPLNTLLGEITGFVPKLLGASILLGVAWVLATLTKMIVQGILGRIGLDEQLKQQMGTSEQQHETPSLQNTISNALYWFIFLLFLPSILSTLNLQGTLLPVQTLVNNILAIVPNIFAALLIGTVGWIIAQIVQRIVTNLLAATGLDQIGTQLGLSVERGQQSLSQIMGNIVYILVLIPVAITALDALKIQAISQPATEMLQQVLTLLPKLFAATVILGLAYVAGQYLSTLVSNILSSIGFNNIFQWLGISQTLSTAQTFGPETEEIDEKTDSITQRTPSELVGFLVLIGVMLVATLTAVDILQIQALKGVVATFMLLAGQVLVGLVVLALGLYLSNLAFNLITSSQTRQSKFLGYTARISILILVSAMALQQMGIAPNIVNLAFGLLVGGIAAAIALAFGLGGREVAAEQLREWLNTLKQD
ncbi:mechanosensitive ion channel [Crocosphaera sp. UHCC 0190]|uniref:mechanosensitive ion channel n=1 Tax=Crocosphaera sp. UHCC 0190 TaxID=3110246 RepID=UPI002B2051FD|nr:mechanosensitive ion channel [Crocosphaera sp. UHCC 0190]MEA5510871.1 mechanosensitive ion channel [Crocosphaera sp. UHCC 0190]